MRLKSLGKLMLKPIPCLNASQGTICVLSWCSNHNETCATLFPHQILSAPNFLHQIIRYSDFIRAICQSSHVVCLFSNHTKIITTCEL